MSNFYQLPISGDWVRLSEINRIEVTRTLVLPSGHIYSPACVEVWLGEGGLMIECMTDEEAIEARDAIAAAVVDYGL